MNIKNNCACLNDKDISSDVLEDLKSLIKLYSQNLCECAEENIRCQLSDCICELDHQQFACFEFMNKKGYYPTKQAPEGNINQAIEKFCNKL